MTRKGRAGEGRRRLRPSPVRFSGVGKRMTPDEIAELRRTNYNATVAWMRKSHPDLLEVRVRPDFPLPPHRPGQYSSLGLGYWEPRVPGCQEEAIKPGQEAKLVRR